MSYEMQYSDLGRTGLKVSRIGYGGAALGNAYTPVGAEDGVSCVHRAVDEYGINYFDTAAGYGKGSMGETRLGEALSGGWREKVILATKCGDYYRTGEDGEPVLFQDYSAKTIRAQLEHQLRRLRTDYVDVLQLHDINLADRNVLMEESIPEMLRLRDEGKIRFLGITCLKLHCLRYVLEHSDDIDVVLTFGRYNLMDQALVGYFDDLRAKKGFALLNCSVLFMGILTKSVIEDRYFSMQGRREHDPEYGETVTALKRASDLCDAHGVDLGSLAFQFGCDCPFCDSTVVSMGRTARLDQNMALWKEPYDRALAEEVRQILAPYNCITRSFRSVSRW